jgi:hypothetical protein
MSELAPVRRPIVFGGATLNYRELNLERFDAWMEAGGFDAEDFTTNAMKLGEWAVQKNVRFK